MTVYRPGCMTKCRPWYMAIYKPWCMTIYRPWCLAVYRPWCMTKDFIINKYSRQANNYMQFWLTVHLCG